MSISINTIMTKIALYLAGHMRGFCSFVENNIQEFISGYDVDIFVATHTYQNHHVHKNSDGTQYNGSNIFLSEKDIEIMLRNLPVKGLVISDDSRELVCVKCRVNNSEYSLPTITECPFLPDRKKRKEFQPIPTHCFMCKSDEMIKCENDTSWEMWRNVWKCHSMAKKYEKNNGIKYKYYIRSRPDLVFLEKIDFNKLLLSENIIIGFGGTLGYPDDQFAIGEEKVMDSYCDIFKVLNLWLHHHETVLHCIYQYPVCGYLNTGLVRMKLNPEPNKIIVKVDEEKWLMYYDRKSFNIPGISYRDRVNFDMTNK